MEPAHPPGRAGTPTLTGSGSLVGGSALRLDLSGARPTSPAVLLIGFSRIDAPLFGGLLVPRPQLNVATATDGLGAGSLSIPFRLRLPEGTEVFFQHWVFDPGAISGLAATNALSGSTP